MPAELDRPGPIVSISAPSELEFALFATTCISNRNEWVRQLLGDDLVRRVSTFWGDHGDDPPEVDWSEVLLVAQRLGVLYDADLDRFFEGVESVLANGVRVPPMRTETDETRAIIKETAEQLRTSPETRARYIQLLREIWAVLEPEWETSGRDQAERRASALRSEIGRSGDLTSVIPAHSIARRGRYESILSAGVRSGEAVIVPLYFAGFGQFFTELDHLLMIAFGEAPGADADNWREQAEAAAGRFKVFSDPTRAAILSSLTRSNCSITDLAERFGLAQPTVSVHVKALRQAGLLESEKFGAQTIYRARESRIRKEVGDALELLLKSPRGGDGPV